jgi:hypothetical protein
MKEYKRICPTCKKELTHKHYVSFRVSLKKNKPCSKCANLERANRIDEREKNSLRQLGKRKGIENPFFGKKHTNETKQIIKEKRGYQIITKGKDNPLFGKTLEEIVGTEKANEIKLKKSINYSGKGNPMYGKPSPKGSGNGWSGWYNGWFFRSLLELSYMINIIERYQLNWLTGEIKKYKINYIDYKGVERNYFPDFIINGKYMVELKPKSLFKSDIVIRKKNAAKLFCEKNDMTYKLTCVPLLSNEKISELIETKKITLTQKYERKYNENYRHKNN